jgi:cytochrome c-type biogenesis protein CcmH/NrfG
MKYILLVIVFGISVFPLSAQNKQQDKAKSLFEHHKDKKALKAYKQILKKDAKNLKALWHSSLLYSRLGDHTKNKNHKKKYYKMAKKMAYKALKVDDSDTHANYAQAVALGENARITDNINEKLKAAKNIRKYAKRAIKADSTNAGAWFLLANWNYNISSKGNLSESMPGLKGASMKNAKKAIHKALKLQPSNVHYLYVLAQVQKATDENKKALKTCQKVIHHSSKNKNDKEQREGCQKIIHQLNGDK